jgi:hypothetical protein
MTRTINPDLDPETDPVLQRSSLGFPVVGIGASAGGLVAIEQLLNALPASTGMAYVVVLHLAPDSPSMLHEILQRSTGMPVLEAFDDMPIQADHVYVIPPGRSLAMNDGHFRLGPLKRTPTRHLAIDDFFRSLGEVHMERGIAVVLSGAGSDGSQGLRRVKERGGVTLVQSPADAEHESMPLNAIAAGVADFVLPASDMAQKLIDLWHNARHIELPNPPTDLEAEASPTPESEQRAEEAMNAVMHLLRERSGHDFAHYKRATVLRRLERRMQVSQQPTLPAYAGYLQAHPQETAPLLQDMLISVTNFSVTALLLRRWSATSRRASSTTACLHSACAHGSWAVRLERRRIRWRCCCWNTQAAQAHPPVCKSSQPTSTIEPLAWRGPAPMRSQSVRTCRPRGCASFSIGSQGNTSSAGPCVRGSRFPFTTPCAIHRSRAWTSCAAATSNLSGQNGAAPFARNFPLRLAPGRTVVPWQRRNGRCRARSLHRG